MLRSDSAVDANRPYAPLVDQVWSTSKQILQTIKQLNLLAAYAYFFNPLRMLLALVWSLSRLPLADAETRPAEEIGGARNDARVEGEPYERQAAQHESVRDEVRKRRVRRRELRQERREEGGDLRIPEIAEKTLPVAVAWARPRVDSAMPAQGAHAEPNEVHRAENA